MRFSKYKSLFMILSVLTIVSMFVATYTVYGGFEHSITFNGGIRFSVNAPVGVNKERLEADLKKGGFPDPNVRLVDVKKNQYDLEFGPKLQEQVQKEIEAKGTTPVKGDGKKGDSKKTQKKPAATDKKNEKSRISEDRSVIGEIEKKLLGALPYVKNANIVSREAISASYGGNLTVVAIQSLIFVVIVIGLYLAFRFQLSFAAGASLALAHDIIMAVGFIGVMRIEPSIPVVAAVLTLIGYSINDTIVIFDRIRENMEERSSAALDITMDLAITQTLSRTVITSLLTILAALALLFGGAVSLHDFAKVLIFGVLIGTYSSIFIASHFVQYYEKFRARMKSA